MRNLFTNNVLTIPSGKAVSGIATEAQTLRVLSGRVWITVEGCAHDYWLFAGDRFTLFPGALTVIEADGTASKVELVAEGKAAALDVRRYLRRLAYFAQRFVGNRDTGTGATPAQ